MRLTKKRIAALFAEAPMPRYLREASPKLRGDYLALRAEFYEVDQDETPADMREAVRVICKILGSLFSHPGLVARRSDVIENFYLRLSIMQRALVRRLVRRGASIDMLIVLCGARLGILRESGGSRDRIVFRETRLAALLDVRRELKRKSEKAKARRFFHA